MKGGLDTLVLRLTNRCNLACGYCYAGSGPAGEDLSPERAAEAVDLACPPGGALRIQFTGGEPLLRWDTAAKVLDFGRASGRRFHAAIQTNGTLLTPALCRELRARRVAVGVSLDGVGPDNAARRTPEGEPSFQATARGLQTLAAAGMAANLTAVVSAGSVRGLDRLLDFALWCGNVHGVGLDLVRPQGRGAGAGLSPSPQALAEGLNRLLARHDQLARLGRPVRLKELERLRLLLRTGCRRDCYCNAQTGRSLAVTLEPPEECARCPAFGLCGGGCPAARRAGPSPLDCQMHRRMLEHACRLEGKLEWWNTWKTAFPDREEPDDKEESQ